MSAKFQYVGKENHKLAGIGDVVPGQVFPVTDEQAEALQKNAPQLYKRVIETPAKVETKTEVLKSTAKPVVKDETPKGA